jgi:ABC-type multidrug transport system fused ATPase/permease subunit
MDQTSLHLHGDSIIAKSASVDLETDRKIQETIRLHFQEATVLTIAHRLETLRDYDKVMLIDGGRLVAYGPTNSILKSQKDLLKEIE